MNLLSRAGEYLQVHNDEFDSTPDSIGVSTVDYGDADFEISGRFPEEPLPEGYVLPKQKRVTVEPESEMYAMIDSVFETIRENVTITGEAEITSIHISHTHSKEDMEETWPFYTAETADARVFIGVTRAGVPESIKRRLIETVVSELQELDSSVTAENITNVEYLFSDRDECLLQTVRGYVQTPTPYSHYAEVESVEEYVDAVSDNDEEYEALLAQELYEIYFRLADAESTPSDAVREEGEQIMMDFVSESLETEWETIIEAEGIYFGEFDDGLLDEMMKYYINVPIVGDEIGVSK